MTEKIHDIQKETCNDIIKKLKAYHKCLLVRPTGFGKTKTAVDIMREFKHVIFLYPYNSVKTAISEYDVNDIDLHLYSYSRMRNTYKQLTLFNNIFSKFNNNDTLFIIDEAHFIGGPKISIVIEYLMKIICPNANYLGLTATPNRTDKLEIKWHFFDGIVANKYGLSEAFRDNIFIKPYYVYTPLDGASLEKYLIKKIDGNDSLSANKKYQLKTRIKEKINPQKLNIENLDEIIYNNLDKFRNNIDYYKFILFFTTFEDIHNKKKEIVSAFEKVFPDCEINTIIVSSENSIYRLNLNSIDNLYVRPNTIDLIFNINMLTFGYHVDDITGIMMFRQTISNIVYTQQIGRCLSVVQQNSTIIFDFVENLYKSALESVSNFSDKNNILKNASETILSIDDVILDDRSTEILNIERLINNTILEEFEEEVVNAYKLELVDIEYCVAKLQLHSVDDFKKILERYK